jgi:uncharacterized protein (TIGR00369 family)
MTMAIAHDIPFLEWIGATLVEWGPEHALLVLPIAPHHLNRSGVVHGGVYAVLADAACGLAGCWSDDPARPRKSFTLSLTTSFLGTAAEGRLVARGSLRRRGGRIYFSTVEITNDAGVLVTLGEGSFRYRTPDAGTTSRATPERTLNGPTR